MLIVASVKKSKSFSQENALAVVRFVAGTTVNSKFAKGSLSDSENYSLTYDLSIIYSKEAVDDDGKFSANEAYKLFKEEMKVGNEEPVNGFEFSISDLSGGKIDAVKIVSTGRIARVLRPACYGSEAKARLLAQNNLRAQLTKKAFLPYVEEETEQT